MEGVIHHEVNVLLQVVHSHFNILPVLLQVYLLIVRECEVESQILHLGIFLMHIMGI